MRLYCEAVSHKWIATFVTFTYANEHLPADYSVSRRPMQLAMKRLRKELYPEQIRFFLCGEYGDQDQRPHYHAVIFGWDAPDRYLWRKTRKGNLSYRSPLLEKVWPFGHVEVMDVTLGNLGYVAGYVTRKITGDMAEEHYRRVHPLTGEVVQVSPEFIAMSMRPGIGFEWFSNFKGDAFPKDYIVAEGSKRSVPKYFTRKLREADEAALPADSSFIDRSQQVSAAIKRERMAALHDPKVKANSTPERMAVREESLLLRMAQKTRDLDE